ncbi:MAG: hypothetical protein H6623_09715 [Bdellovibrionaceae bacterium]|nr:hypothetical protein [Pseudobdellovibrionaceae bacterium]
MSFFAPQAYTKETLAKAFEWLHHQPSSVKQAASSPDLLVSIYLQAQRQGIQKIDADAPVSSKKFIDDLKALSRDFAQFDEVPPAVDGKYQLPTPQPMMPATAPTMAPSIKPPVAETLTPRAPTPPPTVAAPIHATSEKVSPRPAPPTDGFFSLDEKSLSMIRKVQERFNLSSPQEALRMTIVLGMEQIARWSEK